MPHSLTIDGNVPMNRAVDFAKHRDTMRYKIRPIRTMPELRDAMAHVLGDCRKAFKDSDAIRAVTFGSCFAVNVADAMRGRGIKVYTACITEDVNSPFNNRMLLNRVFDGINTPFTDELQHVTGVNFEELRANFLTATDIIFTLGNIFHIESENGPCLLSKPETRLVAESYEETVSCIADILAILKRHVNAKIYVSVSPVPISGYRGVKYRNEIEADCASKCQLLTALRSLSGYRYIPTFEVFRWLAAHQEFATFGDSEGHPRHICKGHIDMAMDLLCN